jgi:hypothetical protein
MSCFFLLPREIRDIVYSLVLCVDGIVLPYVRPQAFNSYRASRISTGLLLVNKKVREEALPTWFGHNIWRIPSRIDWNCVHSISYEESLFKRYGLFFRKIVIDYDSKDELHVFEAFCETTHRLLDFAPEHSRRIEILHKLRALYLTYCWRIKNRYIKHMTALTSITVDIDRLSCPLGCCRLEVLRRLLDIYLLKSSGVVLAQEAAVMFVGAQTEVERECVDFWARERGLMIPKQQE